MNDDRPPSGCRHCGIAGRLHFDRWTDAAGWHEYEPPTAEQVRERMLARRSARQHNWGTS